MAGLSAVGSSTAVSAAVAAVSTDSDISMVMAGKALDQEKQEGAQALQLIAATGKGAYVDSHA